MQGLSLLPRGIEAEVALADLSADDKVGYVLEYGAGGVQVPDADGDIPACVLVNGAEQDEDAGVVSLGNSTGEVGLRAAEAIAKGDRLCMATGADRGKTRKKPAAGGGTVYVYGRAKQAAEAGALFRAEVFSPVLEDVPA
jgi:hypothetical protein